MLGVFAEFETNLRRERQMEGITKAKAAGVYKGRKPKLPRDEIRAAIAAGTSPAGVAKQFKIARSSVYRILGGQPA
jgi:DNA invertase Pin-like site-specific DNA recombinase